MEIFPRRGIELSLEAEVLFPRATYEHPAIVVEFETGYKERRARTVNGRFRELVVTVRANQFDMNVVMDFLRARKLSVEPFTLVHPDYGTGTVNYASQELPLTKIVAGNPAWFQFEVPMEAAF